MPISTLVLAILISVTAGILVFLSVFFKSENLKDPLKASSISMGLMILLTIIFMVITIKGDFMGDESSFEDSHTYHKIFENSFNKEDGNRVYFYGLKNLTKDNPTTKIVKLSEKLPDSDTLTVVKDRNDKIHFIKGDLFSSK